MTEQEAWVRAIQAEMAPAYSANGVTPSVAWTPLYLETHWNTWRIEPHMCWFCATVEQRAEHYLAMPKGYTLCSACGALMYTGLDDPTNEAMDVCLRCENTLFGDEND